MPDTAVHTLGISFAIATATGTGLLAGLVLQTFRRSPIRNVITTIALVMAFVGIYHVVVLIAPPKSATLRVLGSAKYAVFAVVLWLMIRLHATIDVSIGEYRRSPVLVAAGTGGFILGGLLSELLVPAVVHWAHGGAALLVGVGAYQVIDTDVRTERWGERLISEPTRRRPAADWMTPLDDAVLELCSSSGLVLTPAIIAFNIDYSREEVNRRLTTLETHDFVERVERGKYRITARGEQYLYSPLSVSGRVTETTRES